jgi:hypothetical protein
MYSSPYQAKLENLVGMRHGCAGLGWLAVQGTLDAHLGETGVVDISRKLSIDLLYVDPKRSTEPKRYYAIKPVCHPKYPFAQLMLQSIGGRSIALHAAMVA